jgi:general stress protein 26
MKNTVTLARERQHLMVWKTTRFSVQKARTAWVINARLYDLELKGNEHERRQIDEVEPFRSPSVDCYSALAERGPESVTPRRAAHPAFMKLSRECIVRMDDPALDASGQPTRLLRLVCHPWKEQDMSDPKDLERKMWKAIKTERTLMLGLDGAEDGHARPMTAMIENEHGPIWFFTSKDNVLISQIGQHHRAIAVFVAKSHDLFASIKGNLVADNDRAVIDRLWSPFVAAWFKGGKDDPKLALLRLDAEHAEIWENASSLAFGLKILFGGDPKMDYKDKVADVDLR